MDRIGVLDSGLGGISVLRKIIKRLPNASYIYFSDSIHNPYGDKTHEEILQIIIPNIEFLIHKNCTIIVLACNTATAVAIDYLRQKYPDTCFIGTEPAIKVVHDLQTKEKTLLLATKLTLECERVQGLIEKYAPSHLITYPCVGLAELIERRETKKIETYFQTNLKPFSDVSYVVLGCTHYPLIQDLFQKYFKKAQIIDGSEGVSKQVLRKAQEISFKETGYHLEFIDTSQNQVEKQKNFEYYYQNKII